MLISAMKTLLHRIRSKSSRSRIKLPTAVLTSEQDGVSNMKDLSRDVPELERADEYTGESEAVAAGEANDYGDCTDTALNLDGEETPSEYESDEEACAGISLDADLEELKREFSELSGAESITELKNPVRYAALRELGLSAKEAYLATTPRPATPDTKSHLRSSVPSSVKSPYGAMTRREMRQARDLFGDMNDAEIQTLYQKVTKQN